MEHIATAKYTVNMKFGSWKSRKSYNLGELLTFSDNNKTFTAKMAEMLEITEVS